MAGTVIIPWYATGFRAERFEQVLNDAAAVALRYGASSYAVYRSCDDRYKFQQLASFDDHGDWERYWEGPELTDFRVRHSSWYQIPVLYSWWDKTVAGGLPGEPAALHVAGGNGSGNGARAGNGPRVVEGESA
jgi:hypothetical protein